MALQSEKFESIVKSLQKDNTSSGDDKTGVPTKSMEYFKKSEESLKGIDKSLKLIQESFAKNISTNKNSKNSGDTEPSGSSRAPGDYTVTEELKGAVGRAKSLGQGIASFASNPVKSISNAFGGVKDYAKDILSTPADYDPDKSTSFSNRTVNPESDNVQSSGEIISEEMEQTNELIGENISIAKLQIEELKQIRLALVPDPSLDEYTKNHDKKIIQKFDELIEAVKEGGAGSGGGIGGLLGGLGAALPGAGALGKGIMNAGKAVLPYALPAAAMIGTGAAVDYGLGKLGVGKDAEGKDLKIDTAQDDANWKKMTFGQKVESGIGRGIEKVGSTLFLDNMSREAQADRIKNETQYFKDKDYVDSNKAQDDANWDKMSFGKKILSGINRGGEKLSLLDSTKTTAARIRKETEDLKNVPGAATKAAVTTTPSKVSYSDEMKAKGINPEDPDGSLKLGLQGPNSAGTMGAATKAAVAAAAATVQVGGQPVAAPKKDTAKEEKLLKIKKEFQDNEAKVAAANKKVKDFEKANQFDVKPTGDVESGGTAGKFSDPKKQAEYDKLKNEELALGKQSDDIEGKYKIADVGKDVKTMSAATAESLNKKNAEANARGATHFGKAFRTDYKEGEVDQLSPGERRKKYTAALEERGIAGKDIDPFNAKDQYDKQIEKEIRSKNVTGGPGAKIPAPDAKSPAPVVESTSINEKFETGKFSEADFMAKDPANFKKYMAFKDKRKEEIAQADPLFKLDENDARENAEDKALEEAARKFQKEINASKTGDVKVGIEKLVSGGPGAKNPAPQRTEAGIAAFDKAYSDARSDGKSVKESKEIAHKARNAVDTKSSEVPVVEKKPSTIADIGKKAGPALGAATIAPVSLDEPAVGKKLSPKEEQVAKLSKMGDKVREEAKRLGIEPGKGQGVFEGGVLTKMVDTNTGKEHDIEISEKDKASVAGAREMRAMNENSGRLAAAASRNMGNDVTRASTDNIDLNREASRSGNNVTPIVSNNISTNNNTSYVPMKPTPRNERGGSALDRYQDRVSAF